MTSRIVARYRVLLEFLFPREAERDSGFQAEVKRLSRLALRIIAMVCSVLPVIGYLFGSILRFAYVEESRRLILLGLFLGIAVASAAVSRMGLPTKWIRLACVFGGMSCIVLFTLARVILIPIPEMDQEYLADVATVMLVGVAVIPAKPLQILSLGVTPLLLNTLTIWLAPRWGLPEAGFLGGNETFGLVMITVLCTGLGGINYQRLFESYRAHREALAAQSRALQSEGAASMGRLASALSHELNTPLGTLRSSVQLLPSVINRVNSATSEGQRERLVEAMVEISNAAERAVGRMEDILVRMRRFTNLDRAQVQEIDLNQLLRDVASLVGREALLEFDLRPLPSVISKPQPLSAVLSSLLHQAIEAGGGEPVRVSTSARNGSVSVEVARGGPSLTATELAAQFDPRFRTDGDRIGTGNWDLFTSRQLVNDLGGEIRVESAGESGAAVTVELPRSCLSSGERAPRQR